jgi:hypothetical protein
MLTPHRRWRIVAVCGVVCLVLAVTVLSGAAQGFVGIMGVFAVVFAIVRGLDNPDIESHERHIARDRAGSGNYQSGLGAKRQRPSHVGPVNTPEQDRVDALERSWRASPPADT